MVCNLLLECQCDTLFGILLPPEGMSFMFGSATKKKREAMAEEFISSCPSEWQIFLRTELEKNRASRRWFDLIRQYPLNFAALLFFLCPVVFFVIRVVL